MMSADRRTPGTFSSSLGAILAKPYTKSLMRREEGDSTIMGHADQYYVLKKLTAVPRYDYSGKQSFPPTPSFRIGLAQANIFHATADRKNREGISRSNIGIA